MNCPLKPGLTCSASLELQAGTPCPACSVRPVNGGSRRSAHLDELPLNAHFAVLRQQLRDRLEEAENAPRPRNLTQGNKTSKLAIAGHPYRKLILENESQGLALGGAAP